MVAIRGKKGREGGRNGEVLLLFFQRGGGFYLPPLVVLQAVGQEMRREGWSLHPKAGHMD